MSEDAVGIGDSLELDIDEGSKEEDPDLAAPSMTPQFSISPTLAHEGAGFAAFDAAETVRQEAEAARSKRPHESGSVAEDDSTSAAADQTLDGDVDAAEVRSSERRHAEAHAHILGGESGNLQVDVAPEGDAPAVSADTVAASPNIDYAGTKKKLGDLKKKQATRAE